MTPILSGAGSVADFQTIRAYGYFTGEAPEPDDYFIDDWTDYWGGQPGIGPVRVGCECSK